MTEVNRYNLFLNTTTALPGISAIGGNMPSSSNCVFGLTNPSLVLSDDNNYFEIEVINICIPFSFKVINSSNNKIGFETKCTMIINNSTTIDFGITIPVGNYTIVDLMKIWSKLIQDQYDQVGTQGSTIVFTFDQIEGIVDIILTVQGTDTSLSLFIPFSYNDSFLGNMLGFPDDVTAYDIYPTTGPNHYNVSPYQQLFIRSNKLLGKNYEFNHDSAGRQQTSNVIASVNLYTSFDSYLNSNNLIPFKSRIFTKIIDQIDIYLTGDVNNSPIDLYGIPMYLALLIVEREGYISPQMREFKQQLKSNPKELEIIKNNTKDIPEPVQSASNSKNDIEYKQEEEEEVPMISQEELSEMELRLRNLTAAFEEIN